MMGDNYWPYGINRSKACDAHPLAEAASVDAVPFNHRLMTPLLTTGLGRSRLDSSAV